MLRLEPILLVLFCGFVVAKPALPLRGGSQSGSAPIVPHPVVSGSSPNPNFQSWPHPATLTGFRLLLPKWVARDSVAITVQAPASAALFASQLETDPIIRGTVSLVHSRKKRGKKWKLDLRPVLRKGTEKPDLHYFQGTVQDAVSWPDGPVEARFELSGQSFSPLPNWDLPLTGQFQVVQRQLERFRPTEQGELRVWTDHVNRPQAVGQILPQWPNLGVALKRKRDPFQSLSGFVLRSYPNRLLRRLQPYTLYIPQALANPRDSDRFPLLILLNASEAGYQQLVQEYASGQRFEKEPVLMANVGVVRDGSFRHLGLKEIEWVIEDLMSKYSIDPNRIYLQGMGFGGRAALEVAAHLPDRFAAISLHGVHGLSSGMVDPVLVSQRDPMANRLAARSDVRSFLPNLVRTPTEVLFGWSDRSTHASLGLTVGLGLRQWRGSQVVMRGFSADHRLSLPEYDLATTRKWFQQHRRQQRSDEVRLRLTNLRYGRSAWLEVTSLQDYSDIGRIHARYLPETQHLLIQCDNVGRVTYTPPGEVETMVVNGKRFTEVGYLSPGKNGRLAIHQGIDSTGQLWVTTVEPSPQGRWSVFPGKRPGVSGPIWDVWTEPFRYVWSEEEEPAVVRRLEQSARESAYWESLTWGPKSFPVSSESRLNQSERLENLILFVRDPKKSQLLKHSRFPWPFSESYLGGEPQSSFRQGLQNLLKNSDYRIALFPSPLNPDAYLLVVMVTGEKPVNLRRFTWLQPALNVDWLVGDLDSNWEPGLSSQLGTRHGKPPKVLAAGVYDQRWKPAALTTSKYDFPTYLPGNLIHDSNAP